MMTRLLYERIFETVTMNGCVYCLHVLDIMRSFVFVFVLVVCVALCHAKITHRTMPTDVHSPRQIRVRANQRAEGQESYSLCSFPRRHLLTVSDVIIEPQNAKVGETITVTVQGSLKENVADGETDLTISWGVIELKRQQSTICQTMKCPVEAGPFTFTESFPIPQGTPNGGYTISYQVMGKDHARVTCIEFDIHISS